MKVSIKLFRENKLIDFKLLKLILKGCFKRD